MTSVITTSSFLSLKKTKAGIAAVDSKAGLGCASCQAFDVRDVLRLLSLVKAEVYLAMYRSNLSRHPPW